MHEELVNRLGGLSLPRKSVVRLPNRSDMTLDVYRGRKITTQQQLKQTHWADILYNLNAIHKTTCAFMLMKVALTEILLISCFVLFKGRFLS